MKPFDRVVHNKKAFVARCLLPLATNLLDHPEITASEEPSTPNEPQVDSQGTVPSSNSQLSIAGMLDNQSGFANTVLSNKLKNINHESTRVKIWLNKEEGHQAINS